MGWYTSGTDSSTKPEGWLSRRVCALGIPTHESLRALFLIIALPADLSRLRLRFFRGPGRQTKPPSPGWVKQLSPERHQASPVQN